MYLPQLLERQASASPDALAIACAGRRINYGELNRQADLIAEGLREAGVTAGCLVALLLDRSPEMVAALLGIWKAGAAYVPLDPAASVDQIHFMLEDADPPFVLTRNFFLARLLSPRLSNLRLLDLDDFCARTSASPQATITVTIDSLAYVIYTSGSTGKPKGARITHGGLVNTVLAVGTDLGLRPDDIVMAWSTIAFDVACLEIYLPLAFGASLYLVGKELGGDGDLRLEQLRSSAATVIMGTPTMYRLLLEKGWQGDTRMRVVVGVRSFPCTSELAWPKCAGRHGLSMGRAKRLSVPPEPGSTSMQKPSPLATRCRM
jgi:non-ribosomal peptide synthetase component F